MEQPKLLIADSGDEFRQALAGVLDDEYQIRTCRSGIQALELLRAFRPDILVTDLMLTELDGLTLLQMALQENIRPKILVTATFFSDYVLAVLHRMGVEYTMPKPCSLQAVRCRIHDFAVEADPASPAPVTAPEDWVANALLRMGFGAHLDGFRYLRTAIPIFCLDTNQAITKELYVSVAEIWGKEGKQVERSIRSAIEKAWQNRTDRIWAEFFPTSHGGQVPKLSNGRFIAHLAQLLADESHNTRSA